MDYSKSGSVKPGYAGTRHQEHNQKGGPKNPFGADRARQELIDRMKAAARTGKAADKPGEDPTAGS